MSTIFLRLLARDDKPAALADAVQRLRDGQPCPDAYAVEPESFREVPGTPFAYWVSERLFRLFVILPSIEGEDNTAKVGLMTQDDFRFLRLWTETSGIKKVEGGWYAINKGGSHARYYRDASLEVNWKDRGRELKAVHAEKFGTSSKYIFNEQYYGRPGITWSRRSPLGLSLRVVPQNCIFSDKGPTIFSKTASLLPLLSLTNSKAFRNLVSLQMAFGSYEVGVIQRTPIPDLSGPEGARLGRLAGSAVAVKRSPDTADETSHVFHLPALLQVPGGTLAERVAAWQAREVDSERQLAELQREIDDIAFRLYGIDGEDRRAIEESVVSRPSSVDEADDEADPDDDDPGADDQGPRTKDKGQGTKDLVSYAIGVVFGRWDLRYATGERTPPDLPDPFEPLPVCSPGMLQGPDGLPPTSPPEDYPLRIDADGLLVDDPDHPDDILRRVREVLELIWKDRADAIEREACDLLGVDDLRDYFRKPGKGGFWDDHISRYSKSRRKAPIYWLLQSSRKNYALWLSYHRLDRDLLFKALQNYVLPRIAREQNRVKDLRAQKGALGPDARGSRKLDKDIDRQEALVSELRDFEDTLRRAAGLHLDPDLNDGVVLNIAPLHELVPWKEARKYWDELLDGKYEWSSIGKQLREKGVVP